MDKFNIRVYGLLINHKNEILITDEQIEDFKFTKFPGGGLEFGEGTIDAIKREFIEECDLEIDVIKHFYTTDFFVKSLFANEQLLSIYYLVKPVADINFKISTIAYDFKNQNGKHKQSFRFLKISNLEESILSFPVDKHVIEMLKQEYY